MNIPQVGQAALYTALLSLLPWVALQGQDAPCTPPHPISFQNGTSAYTLPGNAEGTPAPEPSRFQPPSHFVAADGRLCLRFSPDTPPVERSQDIVRDNPRPGRAFLFSAVAPGAGQRLLGQDRWAAYAAAELWAWFRFLDRRRHGKRIQREYRDLAWLVARRVSTGQRSDAGWEYYETLTRFKASGAYDADPSQLDIQPEGNPETFNGSIWVLAQEIFLPEDPVSPIDQDSPVYQKALEYYLSRAYPPDLAWDWGDNSLHQDQFSDLIRESDENLRRSTTMIGVILANHLLSAIDALVSSRLREVGMDPPNLDIHLEPQPLPRSGAVLSLHLQPRFFHEP